MTTPLENTSKIFAKAADRPEEKRRYIKLKGESAHTSHKKKSTLKEVFDQAQADIKQALIECKRGDRRQISKDLLSIIDSTQKLQERHEQRAGNLFVRMGLFTPREKRETLKSAEDLVETARAAIHVLKQIKHPTLEITDEEIQQLEGNDPDFVLHLLERAGKHGVYSAQRDRLETIATDQCVELFELFARNYSRRREITFENGHWVVKRMARRDTIEARNQRLNEQLLQYMPYINYRVLSEHERFHDRRLELIRGEFTRVGLSGADHPIQLLQILGAGRMQLFELLNHPLNQSGRVISREWIPPITKYLRDRGLTDTPHILVLENSESISQAAVLNGSVQRVMRLGWNAPIEDLTTVYFSGLLDNREFRKTAEIFGQLKRLALPEPADFDIRAKQFAFKHRTDATTVTALCNDLTALKFYNDRLADEVSAQSIGLLLDRQVKRAFLNDFSKLFSFVEGKLLPDADEETWKEFIIWRSANPSARPDVLRMPQAEDARALRAFLDRWIGLEIDLGNPGVIWDLVDATIPDRFMDAFSPEGAILLENPLMVQFIKTFLPNVDAIIENKVPQQASLSLRLNAYLYCMFERGGIRDVQHARKIIQDIAWLKEKHDEIKAETFSSFSELKRFYELLIKYTGDVDFLDLFYKEFISLYSFARISVPENASVWLRAIHFVIEMQRESQWTNLKAASVIMEAITPLDQLQKALQEGRFGAEDLVHIKTLKTLLSLDKFKDYFPTQFSFLESIAETKDMPKDAHPQLKALSWIYQAVKEGQLDFEAAKSWYAELSRLNVKALQSESFHNFAKLCYYLKDIKRLPQLYRQLSGVFPALKALSERDISNVIEPELKSFILLFHQFEDKSITFKEFQKIHDDLQNLIKLERKEAPLTIEEQRQIASSLCSFMISNKWKSLRETNQALQELIPQAYEVITKVNANPEDNEPYHISALRFVKEAQNTTLKGKKLLELLFDIQRLDSHLPVWNYGRWINVTTGLRNNILTNCDENTLKFVEGKFPYTAYAIGIMKVCPSIRYSKTPEHDLFWGMYHSESFTEEKFYVLDHSRKGLNPQPLFNNPSLGDCEIEIAGRTRKVASWFVKTALPDSAYEIKEGRLSFTGNWTDEELAQVLEYCYTGKFDSMAHPILAAPFAKKAKDRGLEALYRAICAKMHYHFDAKTAAEHYQEAVELGLSHLAQALLKKVKQDRDFEGLTEAERNKRLALIKTLPNDGQPPADWAAKALPALTCLEALGLAEDYTLFDHDGNEIKCNKGILALSSELFSRAGASEEFSKITLKQEATFEELDSEALSLAVQYANTQKLPEGISEEAVAKLWEAAEVLEMANLKRQLLEAYDFSLYGKGDWAFLNIQKWRNIGIKIDEAREYLALSALSKLNDFDKDHQDLLWLPGGLSRWKLMAYVENLLKNHRSKNSLLTLIDQAYLDLSKDRWIVIDHRRDFNFIRGLEIFRPYRFGWNKPWANSCSEGIRYKIIMLSPA